MDKLNSSRAPEPVGLYPHARRVGNLLFLSGVGPREKGTKKIPGVELNEQGEIISYDIETQCRSVFNNVKLILEEAGSSWENLVDVKRADHFCRVLVVETARAILAVSLIFEWWVWA
jgi:2-aminomuconate deaminase